MGFDPRGFFRSATAGVPTSSDLIPFLDAEARFQVKKATLADLRSEVANFIDMRDWTGYDLTGNNNSGSYINEAIAQCATAGGGRIWLGIGSVAVEELLDVGDDNVFLQGAGGNIDPNIPLIGGWTTAINSAATRLFWTGASGGTIIRFSPPDDGSEDAKNGGGFSGIMFDCANLANTAIDLKTWRRGVFDDWSAVRSKSGGCTVKIGTITSNTPGGNKSFADNQISHFTISNLGITGTADSLVLYGHITDGNACLNEFRGGKIFGNKTEHIQFENCDSNNFYEMRWNGTAALHADDTGSYSQGSDSHARHNNFYGIQGHVKSYETIAGTKHAFGNSIHGYSRENGVAKPTIEAGSQLFYQESANAGVSTLGALSLGKYPAVAELTLSGNQTVASTGTPQLVTFNTAGYDPLSATEVANNRINIPNGANWATIKVGVEWASNSTGRRWIGVIDNAGNYKAKLEHVANTNSQGVLHTRKIKVTPGGWLKVNVVQTSGGNLDLLATESTYFQVEFE